MTRNKLGRFTKRHTFIFLALIFVWIIVLANIRRFYEAWYETIELADPRASLVISKAHASETISCENPKGYLACKAYKGEISWEEHDKISAIIQCESGWDAEAVNVNTHKDGSTSIDTGIVQRNSIHKKTLSHADSFDYEKAIDWMISKSRRDGGFGAWVCARKLKIK